MFGFLGDAISNIGAFGGDVIGAGWNTVTGLGDYVVQTGQKTFGTFFPTPQQDKIVSEITEPMYDNQLNYRPTAPDAPSFAETAKYFADNWLDSPYESNLAIPAKIAESQRLSSGVSALQQPDEGLSGMLSDLLGRTKSAVGEVTKIKTVADEFMSIFGWDQREPIFEGTQEIGNSRGVVRNTNQEPQGGADILTVAKGFFAGITEQVKGLFNLGFDQDGKQLAIPLKHEIDPTNKTFGLVALAIAGLIVFALIKKK